MPTQPQEGAKRRMGHGLTVAIILLIRLACQPLTASAAATLEAYGRLPSVEDVALSPDGSRLAFIRTDTNTRLLVIFSLTERKVVGGLKLGENKIRNIRWADDDHLMILNSMTTVPMGLMGAQHEWFMLLVFDLIKKKLTSVPHFEVVSGDQIMNVVWGSVMVRNVGGHTVLLVPGVYIGSHMTLPALFKDDLQTGEQSIVRKGSAATQGWLVDESGEVVVEENYFENDQRWSIRIKHDRQLKEIAFGHEAIEHPQILGFGPDPDTALVASIEKGDAIWRLLSLKDGTLSPPLAEHRSLDGPIEDWDTHRMIGGVSVDDDRHYVFFSSAMQRHWNAIVEAFQGEHLQLASASKGFKKVVVRVDGAHDGFAYEIVDLDTMSLDPVGAVYDGVTPLEVRRLTYQAADGLDIPAYLTLPRDRPEKGLPLVVLVHGGPAARDTADFDWWSQALADEGYAVLQPNYRGSDLNWAFLSAGFGEWGRKMQTDVSDGVRYLVKEGIADPARVCIVGASYGGYAALAGVTLEPGVYRCAVSVAGIADLKRLLQWEGVGLHYDRIALRYWDRFLGVSGANDPRLDSISPIRHIDAVAAPVLLIHGRDDTVVPFEQSTLMFDALRKSNKKVDLVSLKNEDHWLSRSETRLQMLKSTVDFLRLNIPPN